MPSRRIGALSELICHYVNYRKQASHRGRASPGELRTRSLALPVLWAAPSSLFPVAAWPAQLPFLAPALRSQFRFRRGQQWRAFQLGLVGHIR
jgi:hypothetical protein